MPSGSEITGTVGPVELYRDPVSFEAPLNAAISECQNILSTPSSKVAGSEARFRQALDDLRALKDFDTAVETHLRKATFQNLPSVTNAGRWLAGCHQLNIGPFRGIFLVNRKGDQVVALVFSRYPHDLSQRLHELTLPYVKQLDRGQDP